MTQHPRYTSALVAIQEREAGRDTLRQLTAMGRMDLPRKPEAALSIAALPSNLAGASEALKDARANHCADEGMQWAKSDTARWADELQSKDRTNRERKVPVINTVEVQKVETLLNTVEMKEGVLWTDRTKEYAEWNAANGGPSKEEYASRRAEHGPAIGEIAAAMNSAATGCAKTFEDFGTMSKEVQEGWLEAAAELLAGSLSAPMDLTAGNIYRAYWSKVFPRKALRAYDGFVPDAKSIWHKAVVGGRAVIRGSVLDTSAKPAASRTIEQRILDAYNAFHGNRSVSKYFLLGTSTKEYWFRFVREMDRLKGHNLTADYIAIAARYQADSKLDDWTEITEEKRQQWLAAYRAAL